MSDWPPPYEYQGRPTAWQRVSREFGEPVPHFHHCPECYESKRCLFPCTLEPDLEEEHGPYGSHMVCRQCAPWKFDEAPLLPPQIPEGQLRLF